MDLKSTTLVVTPEVSQLMEVSENKCYQCLATFKTRAALEVHLIKKHDVQSDFLVKKTRMSQVKYHCPAEDCKYQAKDDDSARFFSKFKHIKQHYLKCHAAKIFSCAKCGKRFSTSKFLEWHVKKECCVSFVCVQCSVVYKTRESFVTHCRRKMHFNERTTEMTVVKSPGKNLAGAVKLRAIYPKPTTRVTASPIQPLSTYVVGSQAMEALAATALSELSWKVVVKRGVDVTTQTVRGGGAAGVSKTSCSVDVMDRLLAKSQSKKSRRSKKDILTQTATNDLSTSGTQTNPKPLLDSPLPNDQHHHPQHPDQGVPHQQQHQHPQSVVHTSAFTDDDFPQFFSSATQTNTELDFDLNMFTDIDQYVNNETQTELINQQEQQQQQEQQTWGSLDEDDCPALLDSHTQTVDPDEYSHNCTQTCNDILLNDFVELTDIETQTAWASLGIDSSLTTTETQTLL